MEDTKEEELKQEFRDHRGIKKETNQFFGISTGIDKEGNEVTRTYPYPHKVKLRILPKDFSRNRGFSNDHLFGMDRFNGGSSQTLTIVEGEEDVASAYQMLGSKWPVVGIPGAGVSSELLRNCHDYINSFKNIVICTDSDPAGDKAATTLARTFPNKVYRVSMTLHKDPNEYLTSGHQSDFMYAWINRTKYVPDWDTNTPEQFLRVLEEGKDSIYLPTGIEDYDRLGLGLMQGHLTVFTAPEGIGKTEFMRMLEFNLAENYSDVPFAFCHLEETNMRSILGLASYKLGKNVTRRELFKDNEDEVRNAIIELTSKETMHQFSIGVDEDPMVIIERIKYYANVCDCKYIFFEPIQDLAHQRSKEDGTTEQFLSKLSVQLSRTAAETGCGIITIAHQNSDGDIRDCKLIGKQASVRVDLSRDLTNADDVIRNTTTLSIVKNRPVGPLGFAGQLEFDLDSFTLKEKIYGA